MKYRSKRTKVGGIVFHSKKEAHRYTELAILERSGEITGLKLQPVYPIVINGIKICKYIGDFAYLDKKGMFVLEDVKGMRTPLYKLKKKLVECLYAPLKITEV